MDAVFLVIVEMFDNFGDGWGGGLRLVVRTLGGGRSLSRSLSLSGGALEHSLSLPDGMSSARESFGLTQIRTACKPSLLHASEGGVLCLSHFHRALYYNSHRLCTQAPQGHSELLPPD